MALLVPVACWEASSLSCCLVHIPWSVWRLWHKGEGDDVARVARIEAFIEVYCRAIELPSVRRALVVSRMPCATHGRDRCRRHCFDLCTMQLNR